MSRSCDGEAPPSSLSDLCDAAASSIFASGAGTNVEPKDETATSVSSVVRDSAESAIALFSGPVVREGDAASAPPAPLVSGVPMQSSSPRSGAGTIGEKELDGSAGFLTELRGSAEERPPFGAADGVTTELFELRDSAESAIAREDGSRVSCDAAWLSMVQDQLRFLEMQNGLDLDHAVFRVATADASALQIAQGMRVLAMLLDERVLAAHLFEVRGGHEPRVLEEQKLVCGCGDAKHRAHFGVRDFAAPKRVSDRGERWELCGDLDMLTRHDQAPANAPRQPVGAGQRTLFGPPAALIKIVQVHEQSIRRSIEMRCLLRDTFAQVLELSVHSDWLTQPSDTLA